jgi:hypothetical protein
MACAAYADCTEAGRLIKEGYKPDTISWQQALQRTAGGYGRSLIPIFEQSGFNAKLFRNDRTREIVVAYEGSEGNAIHAVSELVKSRLARVQELAGLGANDLAGDWQANYRARLDLKSPNGKLEAQYVAARLLARSLEKVYADTPYANYKRVLVGQSLGGGLGLYAGKFVKADVYAIEPSATILSIGERAPNQRIIIANRDPVSDPRAGAISKLSGASSFSGPIYSIGSVSPNVVGNPISASLAQHDKNAVVRRMADIASGRARILDYTGNSPLGSTAVSTPQRLPIQPAPTLSPANIGPRPQFGTPSNTTFPSIAPSSPGGISITRAAAERMPLGTSLDGLYYRDGRIVIAGDQVADTMDAALLLTALRLSCEPSDPYFSLDPLDGAAWNREGAEATEAFWQRINKESKPDVRQKKSVLTFRALSASRDNPTVWASMAPNYPNLKSKLVFQPAWLGETRLGEILYRADVLLKELTGGLPVLEPGKLRASDVEGYVPADSRFVAEGLLASYERDTEASRPRWQGHRLWFDLTEYQPGSRDVLAPLNHPVATVAPNKEPQDSELRRMLTARKLLPGATPIRPTPVLTADDQSIDLSGIFPRMFVRQHDHVTRSDLPGSDPSLSGLSRDVNARIERYVVAYKELRALTDIFRAYVAAVHITRANSSLCTSLRSLPLFESEKVSARLPEYHPTELFITVASYEYTDGRYRRLMQNRGSSLNGGVTVRARAYFEEALRKDVSSPIVTLLNTQAVLPRETAIWHGDGKSFVALHMDIAGSMSMKRVSSRAFRSATIWRKSSPSNSYAQCEQLCLRSEECAALEFERSTNSCDLFEEAGPTYENEGREIGFKEARTVAPSGPGTPLQGEIENKLLPAKTTSEASDDTEIENAPPPSQLPSRSRWWPIR